MKVRGILAVLAMLTLTACGSNEPAAPSETLDAATIERLNGASLDCLDGDMAACNRLRDMSVTRDADYERIGATCGYTLDKPLKYGDYCEVP